MWPHVVATARPSNFCQQELHFMIGLCSSWIQEANINGVTRIEAGRRHNLPEEDIMQHTNRIPPLFPQ
jgi:hypothetical protein